MEISKVFNNNVALATDHRGEIVVMGKGISFQKKPGDQIDESRVEKVFVLQDEEAMQMFSSIYKNIPTREAEVVFEIIQEAEETLKQSFQSNLYMTLADHIHFAIERMQQGYNIKNPLSYEVRKFYPKELEIGRFALQRIEDRLGLRLDEDEATTIALHIVSAEKEGGVSEQTVKITRIVQDILDIVRLHFGLVLDENDVSYNRFVTHLQYFAQRIVSGMVQGSNDSFLYEQVQANYPQSFQCTEKIKTYVEQTYDFAVGRDEQVYLTIHLQRLIN